jgi:hypothetical protein
LVAAGMLARLEKGNVQADSKIQTKKYSAILIFINTILASIQ